MAGSILDSIFGHFLAIAPICVAIALGFSRLRRAMRTKRSTQIRYVRLWGLTFYSEEREE